MRKSVILLVSALMPALAFAPQASAQEKLGVPVCDDFLVKYEACAAKMPAAQRDTIKSGMEQMRTGWKSMTANPQSKAALEGVCKQMGDSMKASMAQYGCEW